jgi:hypothetical protein
MPLDAAFLALRGELVRLRELLRAVRLEVRRGCPDRTHCVPTRLYDAGPELSGLLRKAMAAVQLGRLAEQDGGTVPRAALTRCEQALRKLRRAFREHLGGKDRRADLASFARRTDLPRRQRDGWIGWAVRVEAAVRAARRQVNAATRAAAACWRELAARPAAGITINTVAIGNQVRGRLKPNCEASNSERGTAHG